MPWYCLEENQENQSRAAPMPGSAAAEKSKEDSELCDLTHDHVHHGPHGNDPLPVPENSPWGTHCDQGTTC